MSNGDSGVIEGQIVRRDQQTGLAVIGTVEEMREKLEEQSKRREVIQDYIRGHFHRGKDWGPTDPRSDKPTLMKPGAEKICTLFNTRPTWLWDEDTWNMLGKPDGTVCYVCQIIDNGTGRIVGEGRGAEKVGNKGRDANKAIKNAEKCALVDAALYTFNLSDIFTQDDIEANGQPAGVTDVNAAKWALRQNVAEWRRGCESTLTDDQFIVAVVEQELHKKRADTVGEVEHLNQVILIDQKYEPEPADRFPE